MNQSNQGLMSPREIMIVVVNGHTFLLPVRVMDSRIVMIFMAVVKKGHIFFLTVYCNEDPSCHNVIIGNGGSLWQWQQQRKHGNVSLWSLIWWPVDDVGGAFLPWCWWAFLAMMMMGQNSLLAKCIVVAPQNRCRTNVTKTECECRQSLTHLLTRKNNVVQKKMFFDNLNLTSWQTVQSSNVFGGKYILLAIFSSLLD